jgi:hypothetical protein
MSRLVWTFNECCIIQRLAASCDYRLDLSKHENPTDMKLPRKWLTATSANIHDYASKLDAMHESLIEEEKGECIVCWSESFHKPNPNPYPTTLFLFSPS